MFGRNKDAAARHVNETLPKAVKATNTNLAKAVKAAAKKRKS